MKIGLILECQDGGAHDRMNADEIVCRYIINTVAPGTEIEIVFLNNKKRLLAECGQNAKLLLEKSKCNCVIIVWDLYPPWGETVSIDRDRETIKQNLKDAGVPKNAPVHLVCIAYELETWFIVERNVLQDAGLRSRQGNRVKRVKNFETTDPKTILSEYFTPFYSGTTRQVRILIRGMKVEYFARIQKKCSSFNDFLTSVDKCRPAPDTTSA